MVVVAKANPVPVPGAPYNRGRLPCRWRCWSKENHELVSDKYYDIEIDIKLHHMSFTILLITNLFSKLQKGIRGTMS